MRLFSKLIVFTFLLPLFTFAQTRQKLLFAPFDCREHLENHMAESNSLNSDQLGNIAFISSEPMISIDTTFGWKNWSLVENYSFGKDRGSLPMITDLQALHPFFRDRVIELIEECERKGIQLAVVESYRTHAKQHEYKTMGKQYTNSNAGRSKHQYGLAVDIVPVVDDRAVWDNAALWRKVGLVGEKLGLRWGGRWKKPYDPGHFEWTGGLPTSSLYAGSFPDVPKCDQLYPCLDEDLRLLRKYWNEWETTQSSLTRR
jgi:hypothetical protein